MKRLLLLLILSVPCFNIAFAQSRDQVYFGTLTVQKYNSSKKININDSPSIVISQFGQPASITNHNWEAYGVIASYYQYDGLTIYITDDYNDVNSYEITTNNYYVGKAGRLLIRVGDSLINLNDFVPISYQNRDLNKRYLYINITNLDGELLDSYLAVSFDSNGIITKIIMYNY